MYAKSAGAAAHQQPKQKGLPKQPQREEEKYYSSSAKYTISPVLMFTAYPLL